jgi:hypothetical protein
MTEEKTTMAGKTAYHERVIEGRQCWVPVTAAAKDYEFAFVQKTDPASGKPFYVNIMTRAKSWELPDISTLASSCSPDLAQTVLSGETVFTLCESANGERIYAPQDLPVEIAPGHCWIPRVDRIQQRNFYLNVATHENVTSLPPTLALCRRVQRMYKKYAIADHGGDFKQALLACAGTERSFLSDLVIKFGPEPLGPEGAKDILVAYYTKHDPTKLQDIKQELSQWVDREEELLQDLKSRYGDPPPTYRQRVAAMYYQYNSSKLGVLDDIMEQYCNREVQLLAALVKKYGPEPHEAAGDTKKPSVEEVKERVIRMYRKYNAQRLDSVDQSMEVYRGQEHMLLEALVQKYGPEPAAPDAAASDESLSINTSQSFLADSFHDRLCAFYLRYNPGKLQSVPDMLQRYAGQEEELMQQLVRKYGPEPSIASPPQSPRTGAADRLAEIRKKIKDIFDKNGLSEKVGTIDDLLALNKGAEDSLLEALELKYGASPSAVDESATAKVNPGTQNRRRSYTVMAEAWKSRLIRFFTKYDGERLSSVDHLLANFAGREDELMRDLVEKYGPESDGEEPAEEADAEAAGDSEAQREQRNAMFRSEEARFLELEKAKLQLRIQQEEEAFRQEEQAIVATRLAEAHARAAGQAKRDADRMTQETQSLSDDFHREREVYSTEVSATSALSPSREVLVNSLHPSAIAASSQIEELLRGIKAQLDVSERRSTALRDENERINKQLSDLRRQCDLELRGMRIHLDEVRSRSAKAQSDAQLERVKLLAERDAAEQKILKDVELERTKLAQDVTVHLSERRRLETQIQDQLVQLTLSKSTCQSLEEKCEHREQELVQLHEEVDALRLQLQSIRSKALAATGTQTDSPDQVEQTMRALRAGPGSADSGKPEDWKARALELEQQLVQHQQARKTLEDDLAANIKIVALLKSKKKQLERTVGQLELQVLAIPDIPLLKTEQDIQLMSQRAELAQLQKQLEHMESESRAQKREISDLRNLLSLHLASARKTQKR